MRQANKFASMGRVNKSSSMIKINSPSRYYAFLITKTTQGRSEPLAPYRETLRLVIVLIAVVVVVVFFVVVVVVYEAIANFVINILSFAGFPDLH